MGSIIIAVYNATFFSKYFLKKTDTKRAEESLLNHYLISRCDGFWSLFEQAGSTLNIFAEKNTSNQISDFVFPRVGFNH